MTENVYVLTWLSWNFVWWLITWTGSWKYYYFFYSRSYSVETIDMFPDLIKTERCLLLRHCSREDFQTLHDYNLACGLPIRTRLDDLDLTLFQGHRCFRNINCKMFPVLRVNVSRRSVCTSCLLVFVGLTGNFPVTQGQKWYCTIYSS